MAGASGRGAANVNNDGNDDDDDHGGKTRREGERDSERES